VMCILVVSVASEVRRSEKVAEVWSWSSLHWVTPRVPATFYIWTWTGRRSTYMTLEIIFFTIGCAAPS
jgi:hypothetical protein